MESKENKIVSFGKYKGKTIKQVVDDDINYIGWCITKGLFTGLNKDIKEKALREYRIDKAGTEAEIETRHSDWGDRD